MQKFLTQYYTFAILNLLNIIKGVFTLSLKHGLLGLVSSEGSITGYELNKIFKTSLNYIWHAKTSQIYRELNAMESFGWLVSERIIQQEKPNKKAYSITAEGKEELIKWILSSDIKPGNEMKNPLLMRIFLAGEAEEEGRNQTIKLLREYKKYCKAYIANLHNAIEGIELESLDEKKSKYTKYWKITVLSGLASAQSQIKWAEKAIAILEEEN